MFMEKKMIWGIIICSVLVHVYIRNVKIGKTPHKGADWISLKKKDMTLSLGEKNPME